MSEELAGQRLVQIPSIGDVLILDKPWTFRLFHEYRNETLLAVFDKKYNEDRGGYTVVTLPRGTELRVDRIYIRKGVKDYDSLTFLAKGLRKEKVKLPPVPEQPKFSFREPPNGNYHSAAYDNWRKERDAAYEKHRGTKEFKAWEKAYRAREQAKRLSRPVRFWAKLFEVNKMVVRSDAWTDREVKEPAFGQRAIELE